MRKAYLAALPAELWKWDALDLAFGIRSGAISSREVVASSFGRMNAVNPKLNAVVVNLEKSAFEAADQADSATRRGDALGLLHGVPVTTKINVDQAGQATSNGIVAFKDHVAGDDSPVVRNLRDAGAIIIGRTNTPAFSMNWFTDNALFGRTLNPWSRGHTPGGSSGGASSSVAAGITSIAHGNDLGGSIRYPAYCTGIVGLRPSFGRVAAFNPSATSERSLSAQLMSVQGPLARSVRDARLALEIMAKEDARDPWWVPAPLRGNPPKGPIRVALSYDPAGLGVHPAIAEAVKGAGSILEAAGYVVEEFDPPNFADAAKIWNDLLAAEAPFFLTPLIEKFGDKLVQNSHRWQMNATAKVDAEAYMRCLAYRTNLMRVWNGFLEKYPLLVCPVSTEPPLPQEMDTASSETSLRVREIQIPSLPPALFGLPCISVPTGLSDGLPIGVQIVSRRYREDLILDAAEIIQAHCTFKTPIDPRF